MRDPRTLGPYQPQRPVSLIDLIRGQDYTAAAPAPVPVAATAEPAPPPSFLKQLGGVVGGGVKSLASLPFLLPQALEGRLQSEIARGRAATEMGPLELAKTRLENEAAQRRGRLEELQLPGIEQLERAKSRALGTIEERIGQATDPRLRESLIRGAAGGEFRPFEIEPGPAELAAYQSVLGMEQEEARQKLIAGREAEQARMNAGLEAQQARLEAGLARSTTSARLEGEFELEKRKRTELPATPASFGDASKLRDDYRADSKNYVTIRDSWKRLKAAADKPSAAGDLALLFNYMKILDPTSAVRESEFANAETAASLPNRILGHWERVRTGERLPDEVRADFVAQAAGQIEAQRALQKRVEGYYSNAATRFGIRPADVIVDYGADEETAPPPAPTPEGAAAELARRRSARGR